MPPDGMSIFFMKRNAWKNIDRIAKISIQSGGTSRLLGTVLAWIEAGSSWALCIRVFLTGGRGGSPLCPPLNIFFLFFFGGGQKPCRPGLRLDAVGHCKAGLRPDIFGHHFGLD